MTDRRKAIAFNVDPGSLASLWQAFPEWEINAICGATTKSLEKDWDPGVTDLMIVGTHDEMWETLGLCRGVRSQSGRAYTPLLVLVTPAQESLVRAALDAGASSCLVLPVHPKDLVNALARAEAGNQPGRHTLGLDQAQREDIWRDCGGEA